MKWGPSPGATRHPLPEGEGTRDTFLNFLCKDSFCPRIPTTPGGRASLPPANLLHPSGVKDASGTATKFY